MLLSTDKAKLRLQLTHLFRFRELVVPYSQSRTKYKQANVQSTRKNTLEETKQPLQIRYSDLVF